VIVEKDPAQHLIFLRFGLRSEFPEVTGKVEKNHPRLGQGLFLVFHMVHQYRRFPHDVDFAVFGLARLAGEIGNPPDLPIRLAKLEHQCGLVGISGFRKAVKREVSHRFAFVE
jgi:hypothetical protein